MKRNLLSLLFFLPTVLPAQGLLQQLAGNWTFTASNNGKVVNGVYSAGTDQFSFTATANDDGQSLDCHADCLYKSVTGTEYPADWRMVVEENMEGKHRVGWVLTKEQPTFSKEFHEPQSSYLDDGWWYFGTGSEEHHYIYLLTENEDMTAYVATTFWSEWSPAGTMDYSLKSPEHNSQKLYAFVSGSIPYSATIGAIEIWASPKLKKSEAGSGIRTIDTSQSTDQTPFYDLQGRRLGTQPQKGLYINNRKKYVCH